MPDTHAPQRRKLPATRTGMTTKWNCGNLKLYVTVSFYDEGATSEDKCRPGEVFVHIAKHGSEIAGLMDGWAVMASMALQYGVPWAVVRSKFENTRFGEAAAAGDKSLLHCVIRAVDGIVAAQRTAHSLPEEGSAVTAPPLP